MTDDDRNQIEPDASDDEFPKVTPFVGDTLDASTDALTPPDMPDVEPPVQQQPIADSADEAIRILREKIAAITVEYTEGRINQAQYEAIYARYQEQRAIAENLLARDPQTDAWQQVLTEGMTLYLRKQFEARIKNYVIYLNRTGQPIVSHGSPGIDRETFVEAVQKVRTEPDMQSETGATCLQIEDEDGWIVYVPGEVSTAVAMYTNQPTKQQLDMSGDLHRDFETANQQELSKRRISTENLVLPQRSLFDPE